jgi:hypothetical protein
MIDDELNLPYPMALPIPGNKQPLRSLHHARGAAINSAAFLRRFEHWEAF